MIVVGTAVGVVGGTSVGGFIIVAKHHAEYWEWICIFGRCIGVGVGVDIGIAGVGRFALRRMSSINSGCIPLFPLRRMIPCIRT